MKRRFTSLLLVAMMILTAFAGTFTIGAETSPVITMLEGAAIRCVEPSGIRFISQISTENAEAATEIGTYIFPYAEYKASGAATPQEYFATNGAKFVKIVAEDGIHTDGDVTHIYAALVNIKPTNYCRDFAAISYAIIGDQTSYSAFDEGKNVRNIREIAVAAYNDFSTEANYVDGPYTYWNQVSEGLWSCYSDEARAVIASYDNAIFRLANNGDKVWNGAGNGPAAGTYNSTEGTITWTQDAGKNAVSFTNSSSYYFNVTEEMEAEFADGFSYEVWLKPTATISSGYKEVVDYEELGGWGLNLYPGTAEGTVKISAEIAQHREGTGSGSNGDHEFKNTNVNEEAYDWYKLTHDVAINDWYHIIYTYDMGYAQLFVNGVLVASNYWMYEWCGYHAPTFYKNTPHVVIGAGASGGEEIEGYAKGGFDGALAGLVVYPNAATATDVERMYYTGTGEIDKYLDLTFNNGVASNGVVGGPTLNTVGTVSVGTVDGQTAASAATNTANGYYIVSPKAYEPYLMDGYACEVYFKTPESFTANTYLFNNEISGGLYARCTNASTGQFDLEFCRATLTSESSSRPYAHKCDVKKVTFATDTWYHLVISFDGTTYQVYLDGVLIWGMVIPEGSYFLPAHNRSNGIRVDSSATQPCYFAIGANYNKSNASAPVQNNFGGCIAVFNLYLQEKSAAEVAALWAEYAPEE